MAQPKTFTYGKGLVVQIGNGATPEVFSHQCGITERGLTLTKETGDTNVPDCDDLDAASWTSRQVVAKSAQISSSGVLAVESQEVWQDLYASDASVNCRVANLANLANGGGHWAGKFHLTSLEFGATKGQLVDVSITMVSDGPVTWVPAAA